MEPPGTGSVAENLRQFIDSGLAVLMRVMPACAALLSQPKVLSHFDAMVGGRAGRRRCDRRPRESEPAGRSGHRRGYAGLADSLSPSWPIYAQQRLGRIDAAVDVRAASTLIIGAVHDQVVLRCPSKPA